MHLFLMGVFSQAGCGTQVGNPDNDGIGDKPTTNRTESTVTDPLRETDLPTNNEPGTQKAGTAFDIPKCSVAAKISPKLETSLHGEASVVFQPTPSQEFVVSVSYPSGTVATSKSFEVSQKGIYVVIAKVNSQTSCYFTVTIDETNLQKNFVFTVSQ